MQSLLHKRPALLHSQSVTVHIALCAIGTGTEVIALQRRQYEANQPMRMADAIETINQP